ncbi:MAG: ABC-type Fe3+ transport system periplasmic component [Rhodospirillales bacterium]|nr:ABC-type Fe3+ transport system periplasmic component [Rhodospirillales bacterium]
MLRIKTWLLGICVLVLTAPAALAQTAPAGWQQILDKAKTQKLVIINQGSPAYDATLDAFSKKFGIKVDATVARPSAATARVRTEQKNGLFLADVWWSITGQMTSIAVPAGMLEPFENFLVLPEVKDAVNWRHADYMYGDSKRMVFTHTHEVNRGMYRNRDVVPQVKIDSYESLMNPQLKGKIVVRDSSLPNAGSYALAPIYKTKGAEGLLRFLKEQQPRVYENPEQLDTQLIRGSAALAIGGQSTSFAQCKTDGGCKNIDEVDGFTVAVSRGLAVFKNAPNPEATKVFLNWVLSKEGQETFVREWAKVNPSAGISLRKDVAPAPGHEKDMPDFANAGQYVWVSTEQGDEEVKKVTELFKSWVEK